MAKWQRGVIVRDNRTHVDLTALVGRDRRSISELNTWHARRQRRWWRLWRIR